MVSAHGLFHDVQWVAADLRHGIEPGELKAIGAQHLQLHLQLEHVGQGEVGIEQANERANGARGVVVLGFAQQQGAAAFEIAQVHVVAQARANHFTRWVDAQHHLGLGVVPGAARVNAHLGAHTHGAHGLRFGEDFGIGPNAHLQILRPHALLHQHPLEFGRLWGAGLYGAQVLAHDALDGLPNRLGLAGVTACPLFDHALNHAGDEGHPGRLEGLQVARCHQPRAIVAALVKTGVVQDLGHRTQIGAGVLANGFGRLGPGQQMAHGGRQRR